MYLEFFKLKQLPFRLTADPLFHYVGSEQANARSRLRAGLVDADGCLILTGDTGVGKTVLMQDLLGEMPTTFVIAQIRQPEISVIEFYQAMLGQIDDQPPPTLLSELRASLDACLTKQTALRRIVVLSIDNGELLSDELLDEVLRLPKRTGKSVRNLRIIVAARSALDRTLHKARFEGQPSRPGLRVKLAPLTAGDTRLYVEHRLRVAGASTATPFQDDAFVEMQRYTGGVPRLINTLADAALMVAFNRSHDVVTGVDIRSAINQLQWVEFKARAEHTESEPVAEEEATVGHLRIEHEGAAIADFDLPVGKMTLGRAANNDVRIDSKFVSRHHCQILTTAHYSVIEDLQSQNGLIVSARRVSVHRLQNGDKVNIGTHTLTYTRSALPAAQKGSPFPLSLSPESAEAENGQTNSQTKLIITQPNAAADKKHE